MKKTCRLLALYLPQFHPTPENDEWWGEGFTEWTNVAKARPLFKGHKQPHIPGKLGFYDLRLPETRIAQAEMARKAGVEGFCYWHYWFGNGDRLLERPFQEVLETGKPDFPFCLAWANHSWYKKLWDPNAPNKDILLKEQTYPGEDDFREHFYALLPAFKDPRYVKVDGKPFFMVFKPLHVKNVELFIDTWQKLAKENGLPGIYFVGQCDRFQIKDVLKAGYDAVNHEEVNHIHEKEPIIKKAIQQIILRSVKVPRIYDYAKAMKSMIIPEDRENNVFPTICPNFDHTPRSGARGLVYTDITPQAFANHVNKTIDLIKDKPDEQKIIILKSWNEWGEGNYIEPDMDNGDTYLKVLQNIIAKE